MRARSMVWLAALALLGGAVRAEQGFPGRALQLGIDAGAGAEGEGPFVALRGALANVVERPVEVTRYPSRERLLDELGRGRVDLLVASCAVRARARKVRGTRTLAQLLLRGRDGYDALLLATKGRLPARATVAIPSRHAESVLRLLPRVRGAVAQVSGSAIDPVVDVLEGRADACVVSADAHAEARRQGLEVDRLRVLERAPGIPFEFLVAGPAIPASLDARLRAAVVRTKSRARSRIPLEWRTFDDRTADRECGP